MGNIEMMFAYATVLTSSGDDEWVTLGYDTVWAHGKGTVASHI